MDFHSARTCVFGPDAVHWDRDEIGCLVETSCCTHSPQRLCKYTPWKYPVARFVRATGDCSRKPFQAVVSGRLRYNMNRKM
ncbi:MAG TPA: hypothetical protein DEB39_01080 [Planctomycetaceae bacterium]|nr:hypothetical protein [Planctomycetaceae bacterium]